MRLRRLVLAIVLGFGTLAAATDVPSPGPDTAPLTPQKIYVLAVHAMKDAPQPAFITFRENVAGRNFTLACTSDGMSLSLHHGDAAAAYNVWFRTSDGSALSQPVSDARAKPCPSTLLAPTGGAVSSLGIPQASPSPGAVAATPAPDPHLGSPIIGAVHVYAVRYYRIELAGTEQLAGNDVYHLKLTAYRDPESYPLTDLYIDTKTYLVREARGEVSGHYVIASGRLAGIVDFDRVGNYWLVKHEQFDIAANALFVHARMTATIDGSNFATPNELPGIAFPTPQPTATPKVTPTATP